MVSLEHQTIVSIFSGRARLKNVEYQRKQENSSTNKKKPLKLIAAYSDCKSFLLIVAGTHISSGSSSHDQYIDKTVLGPAWLVAYASFSLSLSLLNNVHLLEGSGYVVLIACSPFDKSFYNFLRLYAAGEGSLGATKASL